MPLTKRPLQLEVTKAEAEEEEDTPPLGVEEGIFLSVVEDADVDEAVAVDLFENLFSNTE